MNYKLRHGYEIVQLARVASFSLQIFHHWQMIFLWHEVIGIIKLELSHTIISKWRNKLKKWRCKSLWNIRFQTFTIKFQTLLYSQDCFQLEKVNGVQECLEKLMLINISSSSLYPSAHGHPSISLNTVIISP